MLGIIRQKFGGGSTGLSTQGLGSYVMRLRPVASSAMRHYSAGTKEVI